LWDDLGTAGVVETRDERVARAVVAAYTYLTGALGTDREMWRWGRLHTIRFGQVVPAPPPSRSKAAAAWHINRRFKTKNALQLLVLR
jgi:acyl-homoserine lactone acylase PvdQ